MGSIVSGVTDAVSGLFGGGAPSQPNTQVYQPGGTGSQDSNLQNLLSQNTQLLSGGNNPYNTYSPQILQAFQSLFNNPAAGGLQSAAGTAGTAFTNAGNQAAGASGALNTSALSMLPGAASVMQMGLDPQSALYSQLLQKNNDAANVTNAQYGLTGQQAAGNTQQADTNFNIDWQNNELSRAIAGLSAGGAAVTNAGTSLNTANTLGTSGAASTLAGGETPYAANQMIGGNQETALTQLLSQLLGPVTESQSTIGNLQNYLNTGVLASSTGANASLEDYYAQLQNSSNIGSGIGSILGMDSGGGSTLGADALSFLGL